MDNINKLINLNGFIRELKNTYYMEDLETYTETAYNSCPIKYKVNMFNYGDGYISILVVGNQYRLFANYNGICDIFDYDTIDQLRKQVYSLI